MGLALVNLNSTAAARVALPRAIGAATAGARSSPSSKMQYSSNYINAV